ncbi:MAG: hypothetical protein GF398_08035 [Chitinivibrionales bacterium]|nr:hypothetical protein [Chitinivibrionales bacterium]
MLLRRLLHVMCLCIAVSSSSLFAMKGLIEKSLYYENNAKTQKATYWVVYLGEYQLTLQRKFPGEDTLPVDVGLNLNFLSSGYVEGKGYCAKGKISCIAKFSFKDAQGNEKILMPEDIAYVYDYGRYVGLTDGSEGELLLDVENLKVPIKRTMLRLYEFHNVYGEKQLKEVQDNTDIPMEYFSFSKEGLAKARAKSKQK